MTQDATYVYGYGFVRSGFDTARAPSGLDDASVEVVSSGPVAALVSRVPASEYAPAAIETQSANVSWLSPRAMAHDRVLTWAQEHGGVIPLPMFSIWATEPAMLQALRGRSAEIEDVFRRVAGADEFGLRVHRRDVAMLQAVHELDPELARLKAEADAASPGQRYLLERKLAEQSKAALRSVSQRIARQIYDALRAIARDSVSRPLVPPGSREQADATMVLNAAFLVERARLDAFRAAVGAMIREHESRGLAFDFTGPWPPYNFVASGDASSA